MYTKKLDKVYVYDGYKGQFTVSKYMNGSMALELETPFEDGEEIILTFSVGIEPLIPAPLMLVKNYSENVGALEWLISNGIAEDTGKVLPLSQYANAHLVEVIDKDILEAFYLLTDD